MQQLQKSGLILLLFVGLAFSAGAQEAIKAEESQHGLDAPRREAGDASAAQTDTSLSLPEDAFLDSAWQEMSADNNDPLAKRTSPGWRQKLGIGGYIKNETAYRYDEPRSITKMRNIVYLESNKDIGKRLSYRAAGRAYYDHAYDLFDYETISARSVRDELQPLVFVENLSQEKDTRVAKIRELYLNYSGERLDLRIGKQFEVWGVIEGIRIVDEINPQDFRELILPDLMDYRIPLWTVKADYYGDQFDYQLLWIPDLEFHRPAPAGSEWEMLQSVPNTKVPDESRLENSEIGFRIRKSWGQGDLALSYFNTWDDFPVVFRKISMDSAIDPSFFPTYTRINMFGVAATQTVGSFILKGEYAYVPDKYFGIKNETDRDGDGWLDEDGVIQRKHSRWALGIEFNIRGMDIVPAVSQWVIVGHDPAMIQAERDTSLTLYVRKPFPKRGLVFQMLYINLDTLKETYVKPELLIRMSDRLELVFGMDIFEGKKSLIGVSSGARSLVTLNSLEQSAQFFGNFNNNDRVFAELKYSF